MVWFQHVQRLIQNASKRVKPSQYYGRALLVTVNVGCAWHLFMEYVGGIRRVDGPSMLPTMDVTGEWIIESRMVSPNSLQRGDLITFVSPLDPSRHVCKRIIGLPGDVICVDPTGKYAPSTEHVVVPKNHLWLSGDNMDWSRDSRLYGPVPMALVKSKILARVWPASKATRFRNNFDYIEDRQDF